MLNYNKSFRQSQGKSGSKSIYRGNKLHTTSMNLKASYEPVNDNHLIIIKDLQNRPQEQRNKYTENSSKSHSKNKRSSIKLQPHKKAALNKTKPYQQSIRILQTDRLNRETTTYRKSIQVLKPKQNRLKTDINEPIKDFEIKKYSDIQESSKLKQDCIEIKVDDLKRLLQCIQSLKKQKDNLLLQLNFILKNVYKSPLTNSALKALRK